MKHIEWKAIKEEDLFDKSLYDKILNIPDVVERTKEEQELYKKAKTFNKKTVITKTFSEYKEQKNVEKQLSSTIDFGKYAPIKKLVTPGYFKDLKGCIRTIEKGTLVTSTLLQPVAILRNYESDEELIKVAFLNRGKWTSFIISRETLMHTGKIVKVANKGVDVTSESARFLVNYIRDIIVNNDIPEYNSTGKMGWHEDSFLPYDEDVEFDGEEDFKTAFKSLKSKGDYHKWLDQICYDRADNVPLRLVMATSFASPLLFLLKKKSFVTLIWGKTGGKKTVSGRVAMSIWRR